MSSGLYDDPTEAEIALVNEALKAMYAVIERGTADPVRCAALVGYAADRLEQTVDKFLAVVEADLGR